VWNVGWDVTGHWRVRLKTEVGSDVGTYATSKGFLQLGNVHAGQGMWLNMQSPATLQITGTAPTNTANALGKGWNLIGLRADAGKTLAEMVTALGESKPLSLWAWQGGKWAVALPYKSDGTALAAADTTSYASSKGFDVLANITPTTGFWVNAGAASGIDTPPDGSVPGVPSTSAFSVSKTGDALAVDFTLMDGDTPLTGLTSSSLRFYLAELVPGSKATESDQWQRWVQERTGTGYTFGTFEDLGSGHYRYTFATPLTSVPNAANQQRLVVRVSAVNGLAAVNKHYDFKVADPATELAAGKDIVTAEACNSCHGVNINNVGHGGGYTSPKTCVICHSPLLAGTDMAAGGYDFTTMIHQIHAAINATLTAADGAAATDWSGVTYPGVKSSTAKIVVDCAKCHKGTAGDNWKNKPTIVACTSCHTAVLKSLTVAAESFTGLDGVVKANGHGGGVQTGNATCAMCHNAGALATLHALPVGSDVSKRTMSATIKSAAVDATTGNVKVTFTLDQAGTAVTAPSKLKSMAFTLAKLVPGEKGASSHWESYTGRSRTKDAAQPPVIQGYSESASLTGTGLGVVTYNATDAVWEYVFALKNADTEGDITKVTHVHNASSATLSPDDYTEAKHPTDPNIVSYDPAATLRVGMEFVEADGTANKTNATFDFVPDGKTKKATRAIVTVDSCNTCHGGTRLHKGYAIEYCVTCHNQSTFDPFTGNAPATVDLQTIIHKLHMGENLPSVVWQGIPYKINGGDFSEVKFPQPLSNCKVCHNEANANGANWKNPTRRACFTCHDDAWDLNVHMPDGIADPTPANAYSGDEVEKCVLCHGVDSTVKPVEEAHYGM